ncbi:MAG: ABC transporter ATP-binding protein [Planctomycetaceae bacterium]|nr:ABC transporter ATP-binding protein [Planctomycetaceae bacterium]
MNETQNNRHSALRRLLTLLIPGLQAQWMRVTTAFVCLFLSVGLRILEPWPLQHVLDSVIAEIGRPNQNLSADATGPFRSTGTLLIVCAGALVGIAVLRALSDYYRTITFALVGNRLVTDLRSRVYQHVQNLSLDFHQRARGGDLTIRLVGDLNMMKDVAVSAALPLLSSFMLLIGMVSVMLWMNVRLGLVILCIFPVFWLVTLRGSRKIHQSAGKQRQREGALAATAAEALSAVKSVQAMDVGHTFSSVFVTHNAKSLKEGVRTSRLTAGLERTVDVLIAVASAVVLWQGAVFVLEGTLSPGGLVVFLAYLKRGFRPLQDFAKYTGRLSKAAAAGDRIVELLDQRPEIAESADAVAAPILAGGIRFDRVRFGYGTCHSVLCDVTFDLPPGRQLSIVGPSGVGKSTLFSLLLRLYDPQQGTVQLDGYDIRDWTLKSLRRRISVVLQDNAMFAATVRDNIAMAAEDATDEDVERAAKTAGADEFIRQLPEGYTTKLGERGANLSQGQRQRIAIARAALRQTPVLLLDEPTSGLDAENRAKVIAALTGVSQNRTTLLITHDMDLAARCDSVLCLSADGTADFGTHQELLQRCSTYATLCRSQHVSRSNW